MIGYGINQCIILGTDWDKSVGKSKINPGRKRKLIGYLFIPGSQLRKVEGRF